MEENNTGILKIAGAIKANSKPLADATFELVKGQDDASDQRNLIVETVQNQVKSQKRNVSVTNDLLKNTAKSAMETAKGFGTGLFVDALGPDVFALKDAIAGPIKMLYGGIKSLANSSGQDSYSIDKGQDETGLDNSDIIEQNEKEGRKNLKLSKKSRKEDLKKHSAVLDNQSGSSLLISQSHDKGSSSILAGVENATGFSMKTAGEQAASGKLAYDRQGTSLKLLAANLSQSKVAVGIYKKFAPQKVLEKWAEKGGTAQKSMARDALAKSEEGNKFLKELDKRLKDQEHLAERTAKATENTPVPESIEPVVSSLEGVTHSLGASAEIIQGNFGINRDAAAVQHGEQMDLFKKNHDETTDMQGKQLELGLETARIARIDAQQSKADGKDSNSPDINVEGGKGGGLSFLDRMALWGARITAILTSIGTFFGGLWTSIKAFGKTWGKSLGRLMKGVGRLAYPITALIGVFEGVIAAWDVFKNGGGLGDVITSFGANLIGSIAGGIIDLGLWIIKTVAGWFGIDLEFDYSVQDILTEKLLGLREIIGGWIDEFFGFFTDMKGFMADLINEAFHALPEWIRPDLEAREEKKKAKNYAFDGGSIEDSSVGEVTKEKLRTLSKDGIKTGGSMFGNLEDEAFEAFKDKLDGQDLIQLAGTGDYNEKTSAKLQEAGERKVKVAARANALVVNEGGNDLTADARTELLKKQLVVAEQQISVSEKQLKEQEDNPKNVAKAMSPEEDMSAQLAAFNAALGAAGLPTGFAGATYEDFSENISTGDSPVVENSIDAKTEVQPRPMPEGNVVYAEGPKAGKTIGEDKYQSAINEVFGPPSSLANDDGQQRATGKRGKVIGEDKNVNAQIVNGKRGKIIGEDKNVNAEIVNGKRGKVIGEDKYQSAINEFVGPPSSLANDDGQQRASSVDILSESSDEFVGPPSSLANDDGQQRAVSEPKPKSFLDKVKSGRRKLDDLRLNGMKTIKDIENIKRTPDRIKYDAKSQVESIKRNGPAAMLGAAAKASTEAIKRQKSANEQSKRAAQAGNTTINSNSSSSNSNTSQFIDLNKPYDTDRLLTAYRDLLNVV